MHWGATSQDIIDTALVLELRAAIDDLAHRTRSRHPGFHHACAKSTAIRRRSARTWLQQALPMPFGLKLAGYAAALTRARERLKRVRNEALVLQFGGAAGTLAALGDRGLESPIALAKELDLPLPDAPWHTPSRPARGSRERARHPRRHLRQDRARCRAPDADRSRRSLRAGGRRPRRLLHHAAQAQSGRGRGRARRARPCAAALRHHPRRAGAGA